LVLYLLHMVVSQNKKIAAFQSATILFCFFICGLQKPPSSRAFSASRAQICSRQTV
jgi:hypothetical protein